MERHPRRDASGDREKQENGSEPFFHDRLSKPFTNSFVGLCGEYSLIQVTGNLHTQAKRFGDESLSIADVNPVHPPPMNGKSGEYQEHS